MSSTRPRSSSSVKFNGADGTSSSKKKTTDTSRRQLLYDLERHPFEVSPLTQLFPVLEQGGRQAGFSVPMPDTIVWENNIPKGWYSFDPSHGQVVRRKVETKQIQTVFLADAQFQNDVVAVQYSMSPSGEKDELLYQFITAAELPGILFENRKGKGTSILQKFVYPLAVTHNDTIQAIWTPTVVMVTRRQNVNQLFDERVKTNTRCTTFEGPLHQTQLMQVTSRLQRKVETACAQLVAHFAKCDPKFKITRLVANFKMSDASTLTLLMVTSSRVAHSSYRSVEASIDSSIHKKYRVSLELATKFTAVEREDNEATFESALSSRTRTISEAESNGGGGSSGGNPSRPRSPSRLGLNTGAASPTTSTTFEDDLPPSESIPQPSVGSMKASRLGFVMRKKHGMAEGERRSVSTLEGTMPGMTYLAQTTSSSPLRSKSSLAIVSNLGDSPTSGAGGQRRSMVGRRSTSLYSGSRRSTSATASPIAMIPVSTVLQELEKAHRVDSSNEQKAKAAKLADRLLKKVDIATIRATYLSGKPEVQLTDSEKMELFFLKLQEIEAKEGSLGKQQLLLDDDKARDRKRSTTSTAGGVGFARGSNGGRGSDTDFVSRYQYDQYTAGRHRMEAAQSATTHTFQAIKGEQGKEDRSAHSAVQARLAEHLYAFQTQCKVAIGTRGRGGGEDEDLFVIELSKWEAEEEDPAASLQQSERRRHEEESAYVNFDAAVDAAFLQYLQGLAESQGRRVDLAGAERVSEPTTSTSAMIVQNDNSASSEDRTMLTGVSYHNSALLQFSLDPSPENDGIRGKLQSYKFTVPTTQPLAKQKLQRLMQAALAPESDGDLLGIHLRFEHLLKELSSIQAKKPATLRTSQQGPFSTSTPYQQREREEVPPIQRLNTIAPPPVPPISSSRRTSTARGSNRSSARESPRLSCREHNDTFSVASDEDHTRRQSDGGNSVGQASIQHQEDPQSVWQRFAFIAKEKSEFEEPDLVRCSWRTIERLIMEHDFSGDKDHEVRIYETRSLEEVWKRRNMEFAQEEDAQAQARSDQLVYQPSEDGSESEQDGGGGGTPGGNRPGSRASTTGSGGGGYSSDEFET